MWKKLCGKHFHGRPVVENASVPQNLNVPAQSVSGSESWRQDGVHQQPLQLRQGLRQTWQRAARRKLLEDAAPMRCKALDPCL